MSMDFIPRWYAELKGNSHCCGDCLQVDLPCKTPQACRLPDDDEDSQFGALEPLARLWPWLITAWAVIGVLVFLVWLAWWPM
jgi:hypothetical protein